ncbi:MAG: methylenetetrahydrofolate reductase, partial [Lachnospiraceae bacterium]|nr:methylenetetrahydrofolate reductase [Lachnospiraceae bacterium]
TTAGFTVEIAKHLSQAYGGVTVLPHLTCVTLKKQGAEDLLAKIKDAGLENIMALRGDLPQDGKREHDFEYAVDLIRFIKEHSDICVGGACYPEGHVESPSLEEDIRHLKEKVDAGCDFLTTQMFFDNKVMYDFLDRIDKGGIHVPVLAGIMPITSPVQLGRSVELSGTSVPDRLRILADKFGHDPAAMKTAGIIYATEQIIDLIAHGVNHIHVYTMNKPDIAERIVRNLKGIYNLYWDI